MTDATRLVVMATGNTGKLREIIELLSNQNIDVVAQSELGVIPVEETGDTFVENALQKARNAARQTGRPAIADDSGLAVDALGGDPGVRSARYAGPQATNQDNIDKLLTALRGERNRAAHFHCAAVFVRNADDATPLIAEGVWRGAISDAPKGDGGFGYDPIFFDLESQLTSAELTAEQKNAKSHRGRAIRNLCQQMMTNWQA